MKKSFTRQEASSTLRSLSFDLKDGKFNLEQFNDGMNVELEHGTVDDQTNVTDDNPLLTGKIALRHLKESPEYYIKLKKMEDSFNSGKGDGDKKKIDKTAALNKDVILHAHQKRVEADESPGKILAHGVGSGKTLSGIAKFEKMKEKGMAHKALVIVPGSLRENFGAEGVGKFTNSKFNIIGNQGEIKSKKYNNADPNADYNIISYDMFKKDPKRYLSESGADTVVCDEQHKLKNDGTQVNKALSETKDMYKNYIGLTGSVISNRIADVLPLVDVASKGQHNLGANKDEFDEKWLVRDNGPAYREFDKKRRPIIGFKHKKELQSELLKYIDYMDYDDIKDIADMPGKDINLVKVPVSKDQAKLYKGILKKNPAVMKMITTKRLETMKDDESAKAFSSLIEARKLMNSIGSVQPGMSLKESARVTPKTKKLLDDLQHHLDTTPDGQALVFSHLINGGIDTLEAGLKDRHIPYGTFTGMGNKGVTEESRQQDARDFNNRKKRVMLVSSAGGEGLSMNDTTWEGVLDPHYNPEKMKQMEARGVRSGGLKHRPQSERKVDIERYMATMPKTFGIFKSPYKTPDEFIYEIANNKERQNKLLFDLLKDGRKKQDAKNRRVQRNNL